MHLVKLQQLVQLYVFILCDLQLHKIPNTTLLHSLWLSSLPSSLATCNTRYLKRSTFFILSSYHLSSLIHFIILLCHSQYPPITPLLSVFICSQNLIPEKAPFNNLSKLSIYSFPLHLSYWTLRLLAQSFSPWLSTSMAKFHIF